MFAKYDLKYLADPKGTMGGEEAIHTMARQGLKRRSTRSLQSVR